MNLYALVIGLLIVFYVIFRFRKTRLERSKWAYPLFLATFPLYYLVFAMYGKSLTALAYEVLVGSVFLVFAYLAYKSRLKISALLVAIASILHAVYDAYHDALFVNPGTPDWWLEFCGSIDLVLGLYLIYFALSLSDKADSRKASTIRV